MTLADQVAEQVTDMPRIETAHTRKRTLAGYAALGLALVACPCHLPLTLGLVAALVGSTAGTTAAARLTENLPAALGLGAVLFVASLLAGFWLLQGRHAEPTGAELPQFPR